MKKLTISLFVSLGLIFSLSAQDKPGNKMTISRTWVSRYESPPIKGALFEVRDSSIVISSSYVRNDYVTGNHYIREINYKDIYTIKTRKDNSIMLGMLIGTASGFLMGYLFGLNAQDDPPCPNTYISCGSQTAEEKRKTAVITTAVFGFAIGGAMGAIKVKINVAGSYDNFNLSRDKLLKHSLKR